MVRDDREGFEGRHTFRRIVEIGVDPVRGSFDAAHLREIHRRIFQDLPGLGFPDVKPGAYRQQSPPGVDWVKYRRLATRSDRNPVAYSSMSSGCIGRLERALEKMGPAGIVQTEYG
ncbi:MAG: hypothetical protein FWD68_13290 [Alphaproteobacteria bacterium]|nr:hypothetical protein [Alphaproteobacteria bacterium]